ncbi:MAG: hypothetical protein Q8J69_07555 [Sphingobacteriaceae bacterium]|nr:hypothetical protein [Sphingobacteriaceae bacterium]
MTLEDRKIRFIQQFLKIENEVVIRQFEKLLSAETTEFSPMTIEELHRRINQASADIAAGNHVSSEELLDKYVSEPFNEETTLQTKITCSTS